MGHTIKIDIKEDAKTNQQKGRRVPLQLRNAVDVEFKNLLEAGHIKKTDEVIDEKVIQTVVTTANEDRSVKIALDARLLSNAILKNKCQMPNLESLMEKVTEIVNAAKEDEVFFSSLDMQYAYGQIVLHPETAKHCNFQRGRINFLFIGGESTSSL